MKQLDDTFLNYVSDILGDTVKGLKGSQIIKEFNNYSMKFNVKIIYSSPDFGKFGSVVKNKRTAVYENLKCFNESQQFFIVKEMCELERFIENKEAEELKIKLYKRFPHLSKEISDINEDYIIETSHLLEDFPNALKHYESAISKYENKIFERNTLDDMRLSLEMLLKDLLKNNKSLENQISEVGGIFKRKNMSVELREMFTRVMRYYTQFQNNNIKHGDNVKKEEISLIIDFTTILMKNLIQIMYI